MGVAYNNKYNLSDAYKQGDGQLAAGHVLGHLGLNGQALGLNGEIPNHRIRTGDFSTTATTH